MLPYIKPTKGTKEGAEVLGSHLEGPFISSLKYGAHQVDFLSISFNIQKDFVVQEVKDGINSILEVYGSLEGVKIVTLAPELPGSIRSNLLIIRN